MSNGTPDMMSTAASIIIVDLNTADYHVLKKHWTFSDDYTGGVGWDSAVKLFTDKELVQEEENTALMDHFLIAGMRKDLANLETLLVIDVLKKDGIWCRLSAVPSATCAANAVMSMFSFILFSSLNIIVIQSLLYHNSFIYFSVKRKESF